LKPLHLNQVDRYGSNDKDNKYEYVYKDAGALHKNKGGAFQAGQSGVKHRMNGKKKMKDGEKKKGNGHHHIQDQKDGQQQQPQQFVSKHGGSHKPATDKSTYTHSKNTLTGVMSQASSTTTSEDIDEDNNTHAKKPSHNHVSQYQTVPMIFKADTPSPHAPTKVRHQTRSQRSHQ